MNEIRHFWVYAVLCLLIGLFAGYVVADFISGSKPATGEAVAFDLKMPKDVSLKSLLEEQAILFKDLSVDFESAKPLAEYTETYLLASFSYIDYKMYVYTLNYKPEVDFYISRLKLFAEETGNENLQDEADLLWTYLYLAKKNPKESTRYFNKIVNSQYRIIKITTELLRINTCEDSDEGFDIFAPGYVSGEENGASYSYVDECIECLPDEICIYEIREYYCVMNRPVYKDAVCPKSYNCKNRACELIYDRTPPIIEELSVTRKQQDQTILEVHARALDEDEDGIMYLMNFTVVNLDQPEDKQNWYHECAGPRQICPTPVHNFQVSLNSRYGVYLDVSNCVNPDCTAHLHATDKRYVESVTKK